MPLFPLSLISLAASITSLVFATQNPNQNLETQSTNWSLIEQKASDKKGEVVTRGVGDED